MADTPFARFGGEWVPETSRSVDRIGGAQQEAKVEGTFRNEVRAGGAAFQSTYVGKVNDKNVSALLVLLPDAQNNRFVEVYADSEGKVAITDTKDFHVDGNKITLNFEADGEKFRSEYQSNGDNSFTYTLHHTPGGGASESVIKTTTFTRA